MAIEKLKFYIIIPKEATNQYPNPRFDGPDYGEDLVVSGAGYSITETATYQRRGSYCIDVTTASETWGGVYYNKLSVVNGKDYVFSCDMKGTKGEAFNFSIRDTGSNIEGLIQFTATGEWQRVECTAKADETVATWRISLNRTSAVTGTNHFYVDGLQFEEGTTRTTFIHGYAGDGYYWEGSARNSNSVRTDKTGMGGELLDIEDYAYRIIKTTGLGMGNFNQIMTAMANGGELYQRHIIKSRNISLLLAYHGSISDMYESRKTIIDAVRPDRLPGKMMKLRFQGLDSSDDEMTNPVDIICVPQSSHLDTPDNPLNQKALLNFTVPSGLLQGAYQEGAELSLYDELAVEYIVSRDKDGNWGNLDGGITSGPIGEIKLYVMREAPDGSIWCGGVFYNAGGIANADYLAKWDGATWDDITGAEDFDGFVRDIIFDANGNAYVCGGFTNCGDGDGDSIVKIDSDGNVSSLGTGLNGWARTVVIDPNTGYIYVAGSFTLAGGIANTIRIAYWDGSNWNPLDTGLNNTVYDMTFAPNGDLWITGLFTNADGINGDYICYWDGTAFNRVGSTELNAYVQAIIFDNDGKPIISGAFTNAGGNADADYIARWNGSMWENLGTGFASGHAYSMINYDDKLYCVGNFSGAGGLSLPDRIAIWFNGSWQALDIDLPGSGIIYSIYITRDGSLYIGGAFSTTADGNARVSGAITATSSSASANSYPFIQFWGPGVLQSIKNYSTGKEIQFDGLTLLAGEWINMQCNPHKIKFESGWAARGNLLRYVIPGSDIADFYIQPGTNYISVLMPSGTTAASGGMIAWHPKFWSIEGAKYD